MDKNLEGLIMFMYFEDLDNASKSSLLDFIFDCIFYKYEIIDYWRKKSNTEFENEDDMIGITTDHYIVQYFDDNKEGMCVEELFLTYK